MLSSNCTKKMRQSHLYRVYASISFESGKCVLLIFRQSMLSSYCTKSILLYRICVNLIVQRKCANPICIKIMGHSHLRRFCFLIFIIFYFRSENVEILDSSDSKSEQHISDNRSQGKLFSRLF